MARACGTGLFAACPADARWNLLFIRRGSFLNISAEGATTQSVLKNQREDTEFLVIKFALGAFMPDLPAGNLLNGEAILPRTAGQSFWLKGDVWQLPDFENVETFVDRLVRRSVLIVDPLVNTALQGQPLEPSARTVRRRFLRSTGLTPLTIQQIERAHQAADQGMPILDVTYQLGYADQPHLTRALRRFYGQTPTQIARGRLSADERMNVEG